MNLSVSNNCGTSKIFYNTDKNFAGAADQKIILESSPDNNKIKNYNTHIVDTITIDQIVIFKNIKNDYHIKIDIDGSEYIVIEGMSNALQDEKLKSIRLETRQDNEKNINAVAKIKKSGFEIMIGDDEKNLHFFRN